MLPSLNSLLEIIEGEDDLREHLPGEHDQKTHGRRHPQIDTPEFKKWFGDSKVVDENGDPLVVYHGTTKDFDEFIPSTEGILGPGIYSSANKNDYGMYSSYAQKEGARVMPLFVSLNNPKIVFAGDTRSFPDSKSELSAEYDGVLMLDKRTNRILWAVAKSKEQIKSATGNRGTFDPSPKINEAHDGPS